jgi:hypothetical protein
MMNSFSRHLAVVLFGGLMSVGLLPAGWVQADERTAPAPQLLAAAGYPNRSINVPDNGAIRRANPNSRQGTDSIAPRVDGPRLGPAQPRPPTLENGGIGNGYPTRQAPPRPSSDAQRRSN